MSKVSEKKLPGYTEQWVVRFWYTKEDGYRAKGEISFYTKTKGKHDLVLKCFHKKYPKHDVIGVYYQ